MQLVVYLFCFHSKPMTITSASQHSLTVLHLSGRFDFSARHAFHASSQAALELGTQIQGHHIVVNLEGVSFVNSAGVALLQSFIEQPEATNIKASLIKPQEYVEKILNLCRVSDLVPILDAIPTGEFPNRA